LSRQSAAPLAVSRSGRSQIAYSAVSVAGMAGMRVSATVPICEIGNDAFNNGLFVQGSGTNAAQSSTTCSLAPYEMVSTQNATSVPNFFLSNWISPHVPLLAVAFDRYRAVSLQFHYEPQSAATVADRLVFAWTDDPGHPFLSTAGSFIADATPTQLQLLVTKDSVAFMPWKDWSLTVPVATDMRFLNLPSADLGSGDLDLDTAESRLALFGSMSCVGSAAPSTAIQYGVLYATLVLDLFDPVPIVSSVNALLVSIAGHRKSRRARPHPAVVPKAAPLPSSAAPAREGKEEAKTLSLSTSDDDSDPPPPRARSGLPSGAPGGTDYRVVAEPAAPPPPMRVPSRK
jgi:hypothetical protein